MRLVIQGRFPGLNEYIDAERSNRYKAAKLKSECENTVILAARSQLRGFRPKNAVRMDYTWVEKDRRRDKDNISSFGRKVIQDGLVKAKVLRNDGWNEIASYSDHFAVDKSRPRVEIEITEVPE